MVFINKFFLPYLNSITFLIIIINILLNKCNENEIESTSNYSLIYPYCITLKNTNIFIIHKYGISLYDLSFSKLISNVTIFSEEEQINTEKDLATIESSYYENYILCLIKYKLFIFNNEGYFLFKNKTILNYKIPDYYSLVIWQKEKSILYYFIGYFDKNNNLNNHYNNNFLEENIYLNLLLYKYDSVRNNIFILNSKIEKNFKEKADSYYYDYNYFYNYNFKNKGFTCQKIYYIRSYYIICFFIISDKKNDYLTYAGYYIDQGKIINTYIIPYY